MSGDPEGVTGHLAGIARRERPRLPMETIEAGAITVDGGLDGDCRGRKFKARRVTILARQDWEAAMADLAGPAGPPDLPWTARRANLLVEGVRLPRAVGAILQVGDAVLEVTGQTYPCHRMEAAHTGLLSALARDWRGGVTCAVREGGPIRLGDAVSILHAPKEHVVRLPG